MLDKLRGSLPLLGKVLMPATFNQPASYVHYEISDLLLGEEKYLNIIAPRGSAKSMLAIMKVIHHLFLESPGQKKVVVLCSKTQGHAINLLQTIKDIIEFSSAFRQLFGYFGQHTSRKWSNDFIQLSNGNAVICKGTGQMVRGTNIGGQRPTLIIVDDPEDENNTKTPEAMKNNFDWLQGAVYPAIDRKRGRIVVIGTPLHERCIVYTLKEMKDMWKTIHYSYLKDKATGDYIYQLEGHTVDDMVSIWPEMTTVEDLINEYKAYQDVGRTSLFYKERLCHVIGDEDSPFKSEYIQFYQGEVKILDNKESYLTLPDGSLKPVNIFMGVDPASSTKQTADFSVIFPVAVDADMNIYCLPYFRGRVTPMVLADKILEFYRRYQPKKTSIETVGYQEMLRDYLRQIEYIPGLEVQNNPRNSKSSRLDSLEPYFRGKRVFLLDGEHNSFIDELLSYPRGKHDDTLDGFYYALRKIYPAYHEVIEEGKTPTMFKRFIANWKTV